MERVAPMQRTPESNGGGNLAESRGTPGTAVRVPTKRATGGVAAANLPNVSVLLEGVLATHHGRRQKAGSARYLGLLPPLPGGSWRRGDRACLSEATEHTPLPAVHKTKVQAIRTYAEALFSAPYLIRVLLKLGAPRSTFCVLSAYITRRRNAYTARIGLPFPRPIPTLDQFDATWKSLTAPLALPPRWNVPTPHRRIGVGPYGCGHNTCNPRQP